MLLNRVHYPLRHIQNIFTFKNTIIVFRKSPFVCFCFTSAISLDDFTSFQLVSRIRLVFSFTSHTFESVRRFALFDRHYVNMYAIFFNCSCTLQSKDAKAANKLIEELLRIPDKLLIGHLRS